MRSIIGEAPALPRMPARTPGAAVAAAAAPPFAAPLVRVLATWQRAATPAARPGGVAERLGQWLGWADAIRLSALLNQPVPAADPANPAAAVPTMPGATPAGLRQALARLQAEQSRAITTDPVFLPAADGAAPEPALYRQACQVRQRAMAAACTALRQRLRSVLAGTSPALARLAALDAALDDALAERARHLLGSVTGHVEQRVRQLRQAAAPGWQARLHQDVQAALLAELDLRLQPCLGLLAALDEAAA